MNNQLLTQLILALIPDDADPDSPPSDEVQEQAEALLALSPEQLKKILEDVRREQG